MQFKNGVSIIVTVFNKEKFIAKTLQSIFIQMNQSSQLIIVNDGSTDSSLKQIKKSIKNRNFDIKLIDQKNSGPSIATNNALNFVKYSHLKLVDGDDLIAPDSLNYMKSEMEKLKIDLLYGYWEWSENLEDFKFKSDYHPAKILDNAMERFILGGWGGSSNLMVKTQSLISVGGCDEKVFVQDYSIPLRIAGHHLKNNNNEKFSVGQSDKTICVGPTFLENRIMDNNGQTLYDQSLATLNFIEEHQKLDKNLIKKCKRKIIARCWSWQKKKNTLSFFSKNFFQYLSSKFKTDQSVEHIRLIVFETWKTQANLRKISHKYSGKKKILIYVGLDLLGDALIKLPFLRCLKKIFPNSHITWLAGKGSSVFKTSLKPIASGLIDEVIENVEIGSKISEIFFPKKLPNFDIVFDTQKRLLTTLILLKIKTKFFISASSNFLFSDLFPSKNKEKNLSKQLLNLALLFSNEDLNIFSESKFKKKSKKIAICPGASVDWKRWSLENFIKVGNFLIKRKLTPVFILGPSEKKFYPKLKKNFNHKIHIAKSSNPMDTIKIAGKCCLGITNDTGCGHLLAASEIPTISLFGPTNYQKFAPLGNKKNVCISSVEYCKSKKINDIPVSLVNDKIISMLKF